MIWDFLTGLLSVLKSGFIAFFSYKAGKNAAKIEQLENEVKLAKKQAAITTNPDDVIIRLSDGKF